MPQCLDTLHNASKMSCTCFVNNPTVRDLVQGKINDKFGADSGIEAAVPDVIDIPVCLPDDINALVTDADLSEVGILDYENKTSGHCDLTAQTLNVLATKFGVPCGVGCDVPDFLRTVTGCQPTLDQSGNIAVALNGSCNGCDASPCVIPDPDAGIVGNCLNPLNKTTGTIDPSRCDCNQVQTCGTDCPSPPLCRPTPDSGDPPTSTYGLPAAALAARSSLDVDATLSSFTLTVSLAGEGGGTVTTTRPVHGHLETWGVPRADGTADVLLDLGLFIEDMKFSVGNTNVDLKDMFAAGGTRGTIALDSTGHAMIPPGMLAFNMDFVQTTQPSRLPITNANTVMVKIDYATKSFSVATISFDNGQGVSGSFTLAGRIANQPPKAAAGPDQVLECTSPDGASATLDGTGSTDPDNNIAYAAWSEGDSFASGVLATTFRAQVTAPIGLTTYTLGVADALMEMSRDQTHVKVQDTTPPSLTISVNPACLWPPNHDLILFQLGSSLPFTATDTCDPNPVVTISNVTSNEPDLGGGQGNFTPDIVFGKHAACVRAEREGSAAVDRTYTITVQATDKYGNTTTKDVVVTVPHDSPANCPRVSSAQVVEANDTRCTQ